MSVRRLYIGIRSSVERTKALREAMRCVAGGDETQEKVGLYFENLEGLRRILTEKRLELLLAISRHRPGSVHELAGLVRRDYKNVNTDITLLQKLGLVALKAKPGKGRALVPTLPYNEIQVTIDLRHRHQAHAA